MNSYSLEHAILRALAYADVFDYPLRPAEVHRYLVGESGSFETVCSALRRSWLLRKRISEMEGCYTLRGREGLVRTRRQRQRVSAELWPRALHYGERMAELPFVRMVAITGALAMGNVDGRVDMDYLIVTRSGRLWLCRALIILFVRWAGLRGEVLCPNYLLSEAALSISDRNLYSAHELAQMVPVSGLHAYRRMRLANRWTDAYLPNAHDLPPAARQVARSHSEVEGDGTRPVLKLAEAALGSPGGSWLERWEMERKIRKLTQGALDSAEVGFSADWCKGHFDGHGMRTLAAYQSRLVQLGLDSNSDRETFPVILPAGISI